MPAPVLTGTLERLRTEIYRLSDEQSKAMEQSIYLGMSPDQGRQADARRQKIKELVDELIHLCERRFVSDLRSPDR